MRADTVGKLYCIFVFLIKRAIKNKELYLNNSEQGKKKKKKLK